MASVDERGGAERCAIDTVEIARIERLLAETPAADLAKLFSAQELADAGEGTGRAASLAARFAAKEACQKLFPRETALGQLDPHDFSIARDTYGATVVVPSDRAAAVLARARVRAIAVSLTHTATTASAVAMALPATTRAPLLGRLLYRLLPIRRKVIVENLRRVFGGSVPQREIEALAQAHYAHLGMLFGEFLRYRWYSARRKRALVRVEGVDEFAKAWHAGKGVLVLTGHFGNFEVSTVAGLAQFPEVRDRIHFVRRAIKPAWLDALVNRRMRSAGFGTIGKRGSLDHMLAAAGERRRDRVSVRSACAQARRHRSGVLRPRGGHVQEPRDHRARDRRAGASGVGVARGGRYARLAHRACVAGDRRRRSG